MFHGTTSLSSSYPLSTSVLLCSSCHSLLLPTNPVFTQEISYSELLEPSYSGPAPVPPPLLDPGWEGGGPRPRPTQQRTNASPPASPAPAWGRPVNTPYSPHKLDGWLGAGKHRTFLPFASYIVSFSLVQIRRGGWKNSIYLRLTNI